MCMTLFDLLGPRQVNGGGLKFKDMTCYSPLIGTMGEIVSESSQ